MMELQGNLFGEPEEAIFHPYSLTDRLFTLDMVEVGNDFLGERMKKLPISPDYIGLCPFHYEKTPSFKFRMEEGRNAFRCFGCNKSGGPVGFVFAVTENPYPFRDANYLKLQVTDPFEYLRKKRGLDKENREHQKSLLYVLMIEEKEFCEHDYKGIYEFLRREFR